MSKFTVRTHTWVNGVLHTKDHQFNDRNAAVNFAVNHDCTVAKVTDAQNRLVYQQKKTNKVETPQVKVKKRNLDFESYA
jgi:hypothetical protein